MTKIVLLDNGSLRANATLNLRRLAGQLANQSKLPVDAVSLQHADKIDAAELGGVPAAVLPQYLATQLAAGYRRFLLLPLFFGLSRALTSLVPSIKDELQSEFGEFQLDLAGVLYPLPAGEPMLADILLQNCQATKAEAGLPRRIVLVDHGSPSPQVTEVRQRLATDLQQRLGPDHVVEQAVMERRAGRKYDFNGDLLAGWLQAQAEAGESSVLVCLMFLLPGRHAGEGGDIDEICEGVSQHHAGFQVHITPLIGDNECLVDLLHQRLRQGLQAQGSA